MTAIEALYREMDGFFRSLWPGQDKSLVFGEGNAKAPGIMLIGEAPGEHEVLEKRPFVGKAGKNLDEFLALANLKREDIYISNVVKIRPSVEGVGGRQRNRAPSREEIALFKPYLLREIALVKPRVIVTLGNVPLKTVYDEKAVIGKCHGQWLNTPDGRTLYALYHPASIIYRRELKAVYEEDILRLRDTLASH